VHFRARKYAQKKSQKRPYDPASGLLRYAWLYAGGSCLLAFSVRRTLCPATRGCVRPGWTHSRSGELGAVARRSDGDRGNERRDAVRGVLTCVLEEITTRSKVDDTVCAALMGYGRALDYEANWGLATDVFSTVASLMKPERNAVSP